MNTGFSTQQIQRMLGLSPARLRAYVKAGLLCPQRGHAGELRFSFQDLLLLRTAEGLVTERLPPRRVRTALLKLRRQLPTERPLTGVNLATDGDQVLVRDGGAAWYADSGQALLSFDEATEAGNDDQSPWGRPIVSLRSRVTAPPSGGALAAALVPANDPTTGEPLGSEPTAEDFYLLGCSMEDEAPEAARVAYLNTLRLEPHHADAHVNLGRLMHEAGDLEFAEEHYRAALALRPENVTASFNLGVVLEDRERPEEAVEAYEAALAADPTHADAHFNAARLHDLAGRYEAAVRHLRAYRNLQQPSTE